MFDDTYHTIAAPAEGLYKEKGSKFLAFAYPVHNTDEVKQHLEALRKEYFDARHHCYAYILGPNKDAYRVNDDGEPSGTGGRPIHGQLLSADLTAISAASSLVLRDWPTPTRPLPATLSAMPPSWRRPSMSPITSILSTP